VYNIKAYGWNKWGDWFDLLPECFVLGTKRSSTDWIEGCVDPRADFNTSDKINILYLWRELEHDPSDIQPVASHHTHYAVPAQFVQLRRPNYLHISNWSLGTTEVPFYSSSCDKQTVSRFTRWPETSTETAGTIYPDNAQQFSKGCCWITVWYNSLWVA